VVAIDYGEGSIVLSDDQDRPAEAGPLAPPLEVGRPHGFVREIFVSRLEGRLEEVGHVQVLDRLMLRNEEYVIHVPSVLIPRECLMQHRRPFWEGV
jgi:hypothetical protein